MSRKVRLEKIATFVTLSFTFRFKLLKWQLLPQRKNAFKKNVLTKTIQ